MSELSNEIEKTGLLGKYQGLIVSLCLLVILVVALLGLNLYFSQP